MAAMTFVGSISLVSWMVPFVLGKAAGLNYVTPMATILAVYVVFVLLAWLALFTAMNGIRMIQRLAIQAAPRPAQPSFGRAVQLDYDRNIRIERAQWPLEVVTATP
jgi:hypothetical protein